MSELQQLLDRLCQRSTAYTDWVNRAERLTDSIDTEKSGKIRCTFVLLACSNTNVKMYMHIQSWVKKFGEMRVDRRRFARSLQFVPISRRLRDLVFMLF